MSKQVLSIQFVLKDGKLTPRDELSKEKYKIFVAGILENDIIDCVMEVVSPTNTKAQLAKIHACINEMAKEQGCSAQEMKDQVKAHCGLAGKSFKDCSKEQLSEVIESILEIGRFLNINFQGMKD